MKQQETVTRHICPRNCYSSCSILGYTNNGRLEKVSGDPKHGYTNGLLCPKGYQYVQIVNHPERLKYPMRQLPRGSGNWERFSWEEAIDIICGKIIELYNRYGTHEALALNKYSGNMGVLHHAMEGFFNSLGKTSRAVGNPCWSPGMDAFYYSLGGFRTSDIADILHAKTIILWGINPAWTSIHAMKYIYGAQMRGAKVITIDPVYTETAKKSDVYIQVKPNGDGAFAVAVAKYIIEKELFDEKFIHEHTVGWRELVAHLQQLSMEEALKQSGQTLEAIQFLAKTIAVEKPVFIWLGFGMQRHKSGGNNIRAILALAAMTGNIGKEGSGVHFGQMETGKFVYNILQYESKNKQSGIRPIDINDFANELSELKDPPVKFLWIASRNLLAQSNDIEQLRKALADLELIVAVDLFMNETTKYADLVLPATTQFEEWDVLASYWHHWISINQPAIEPYYESKSELEIARMLAKRLNDYEENFSAFPFHLTDEQFIDLEFTDEFYQLLNIGHWRDLLNGPKKVSLPKTAWEDFRFRTPSGKIELKSLLAVKNNLSPFGLELSNREDDPDYPFIVLLNHEKFRINSQFRNLDSFKTFHEEPCVYMHPTVGEEKGIRHDSIIRMYNGVGELLIRAKYSADVYPEVLLIYPNHPIINKLVHFTPADMGEAVTGGKGNALNEVKVNIEKYEAF